MKQNEFWDKRFEKYDIEIRNEAFFNKTIKRTKPLLSDADVILDFGCATGERSLNLANSVKHIHGIDTSKKMIERAKEKAQYRNIENVEFSCQKLDDVAIDKNPFTKVFAFNILHLVNDVSININRLSSLLIEDGLIISETPCLGERGWLVKSLIIFAQKIGWAPPILTLTYRELEAAFASNDFDIIDNAVLDSNSRTYWVVAKKQ